MTSLSGEELSRPVINYQAVQLYAWEWTVIDDVRTIGGGLTMARAQSLLIAAQRQHHRVIDRIKRMLPGLAQSVSPSIDIQVLWIAPTIRASVRDVNAPAPQVFSSCWWSSRFCATCARL